MNALYEGERKERDMWLFGIGFLAGALVVGLGAAVVITWLFPVYRGR